MSIGDTSLYPNLFDNLYNVYNESYNGYSVLQEKKTVPSTLIVTLNHYAKKGTISISNMTERLTVGDLLPNEFRVTDYAIPTAFESNAGIDYEIGRILEFHESASGNLLLIDYLTCGDKLDATLINLIIDAIYRLENAVGQIGSGRNLELGSAYNICAFITGINTLLAKHNHTGDTSVKLKASSFDSLQLDNSHLSASAGIVQSKLENGIKELGSGVIPSGTAKELIITSANWETSNQKIMITRGAIGQADGGDLGELALDGTYNVTTGFKVKFISSLSSLTGQVPFTYILY